MELLYLMRKMIKQYLKLLVQLMLLQIYKKIFVVDDDKSIRWVLEKTLTSVFLASCFIDARSMLNDLESITPNVIISDIRMPGNLWNRHAGTGKKKIP